MNTEREWHVSEIPQGSETGYAIYDQHDPTERDIAILYAAQGAKENATLMATAPELLNALKELERQAHIMDNKHHAGMRIPARDWSYLNMLCNSACAAIAKARGIE